MNKKIFIFLLIFLNWGCNLFSQKIPDVKKDVLKNGLTLITFEDRTLPIVAVSGKIFAGEVMENENEKNISSAIAYLLPYGTKSKNFEEISWELESHGARINFSSGKETIDFQMKCRSTDFEKIFDILLDIIVNPSFPEEELERFKKIAKTRILQMQDIPSAMASYKFYNISYPKGHLFHMPDIEEMKSIIDNLSRENIAKFHQKYFCTPNIIISVAGDVKREKVIDLLEKHIEGLICKEKIEMPKQSENINYSPKKEEIKMKDKTQSYILIGHPSTITRENPDFYALRVANHILADAPLTSRLYQRLREEKGYVYFVDGEFTSAKFPGSYIFTFGCSPKDKDDAIKIFLDTIKEIQEKGVTKRELEDAVRWIVGSFPLRLETLDGIANTLTLVEYFNLGLDFPWTISKHYSKLTPQDINYALKKYISPEKFTIIIAGP